MSVAPTPGLAPQGMWRRIFAWPSTRHGVQAAVLSAVVAVLMVLNGVLGAAGFYDDWSRALDRRARTDRRRRHAVLTRFGGTRPACAQTRRSFDCAALADYS